METGKMRVAVEGCGHGTLHAIYASVGEACRIKEWPSVDLLIIGGDFQAVRNQHDLNVTAMPHKYRKMADFHEYYSGARTAPYLTVFIGGNHEASNHLFELYYGGWVAPNIYYMGAANVLRLGNLRIAGLSGIWKGYDYRKPHFERLPYNKEEMTSIFHVREIDVRKLLSLRSQVDVGLSHDWPQGIEWCGDHEWLFRSKPLFANDAQSGRLGSIAARQCLARLRPPHWFSAHLHTKYAAVLEHGEYQEVRHPTLYEDCAPDQQHSLKNGSVSIRAENDESVNGQTPLSSTTNVSEMHSSNPLQNQPQLSAWRSFHTMAQQEDAVDRNRAIEEQQQRLDEEQRTGKSSVTPYVFDETFKQVVTNGGHGRTLADSKENEASLDTAVDRISNLDGCGFSRPLKRSHSSSDQEDLNQGESNNSIRPDSSSTRPLITTSFPIPVNASALENPDAIDIDMSDDDDEDDDNEGSTTAAVSTESTAAKHSSPHGASHTAQSDSRSEHPSTANMKQNDTSGDSIPKPDLASEQPNAPTDNTAQPEGADEVSEEMRAELAALSGKFTKQAVIEVSPALPFPAEITNKTTQFLALGKCEPYQEFLQLLEIESITDTSSNDKPPQRPFKLHYDPEWLSILRVFAPELSLGGHPSNRVPQHRGDTYYHDRIMEERKWVDEHIVEAGLLEVPENFSVTAPVYDPELRVGAEEMPREVTNPQTAAFCQLIGIENPFDVPEEERDQRMKNGPRQESASFNDRSRGGGGGRGGRDGGRGGHGYRGNRGGGGRGGNRGGNRGRGRGRGRW